MLRAARVVQPAARSTQQASGPSTRILCVDDRRDQAGCTLSKLRLLRENTDTDEETNKKQCGDAGHDKKNVGVGGMCIARRASGGAVFFS